MVTCILLGPGCWWTDVCCTMIAQGPKIDLHNSWPFDWHFYVHLRISSSFQYYPTSSSRAGENVFDAILYLKHNSLPHALPLNLITSFWGVRTAQGPVALWGILLHANHGWCTEVWRWRDGYMVLPFFHHLTKLAILHVLSEFISLQIFCKIWCSRVVLLTRCVPAHRCEGER